MRPYRPANGTDGLFFMEHYCFRCRRDEAFQRDPESGEGCPIAAASLAFDIGDPNYPTEWVQDDEGAAECTAFEPIPHKNA